MRMHRRSYKGESYEKLKKLLVCITSVMLLVYPTSMNISCRRVEYYVNFLFTICSYFAHGFQVLR